MRKNAGSAGAILWKPHYDDEVSSFSKARLQAPLLHVLLTAHDTHQETCRRRKMTDAICVRFVDAIFRHWICRFSETNIACIRCCYFVAKMCASLGATVGVYTRWTQWRWWFEVQMHDFCISIVRCHLYIGLTITRQAQVLGVRPWNVLGGATDHRCNLESFKTIIGIQIFWPGIQLKKAILHADTSDIKNSVSHPLQSCALRFAKLQWSQADLFSALTAVTPKCSLLFRSSRTLRALAMSRRKWDCKRRGLRTDNSFDCRKSFQHLSIYWQEQTFPIKVSFTALIHDTSSETTAMIAEIDAFLSLVCWRSQPKEITDGDYLQPVLAANQYTTKINEQMISDAESEPRQRSVIPAIFPVQTRRRSQYNTLSILPIQNGSDF